MPFFHFVPVVEPKAWLSASEPSKRSVILPNPCNLLLHTVPISALMRLLCVAAWVLHYLLAALLAHLHIY